MKTATVQDGSGFALETQKLASIPPSPFSRKAGPRVGDFLLPDNTSGGGGCNYKLQDFWLKLLVNNQRKASENYFLIDGKQNNFNRSFSKTVKPVQQCNKRGVQKWSFETNQGTTKQQKQQSNKEFVASNSRVEAFIEQKTIFGTTIFKGRWLWPI